MKRYQLLTAFLFLFHFVNAQSKIDELVNAEKSFAAFSKAHTTKAAFVNFLDSNSVVFRNGTSMNGLETWRQRKEDSSLLLWGPEFAVISSSGDFGITSGPSVYKSSRAANVQGYYGHFASVWHKNNEGKWKVLCDIGINHDSAYKANDDVIKIVVANNQNISTGGINDALKTERQFFDALKQNGKTLPQQVLSAKARILLQGKYPLHAEELKKYDFTSTFSDVQFTNLGTLASPAKDMFVSYGKTKAKDKESNYLCAWMYEARAWKLILFLMN